MTKSPFLACDFDSVQVARALRYAAKMQGKQINMTQIMKLLYLLYGTALVSERIRITSEHPRTWTYGPVFPRVHKHLRLSDLIVSTEYDELKAAKPDLIDLLDQIVRKFGDIPASQLSSWSQQPGCPWALAGQRSHWRWNTALSDEDIYDYFFSYVPAK